MAFYGSTSIKRTLTDLKTWLTTNLTTKVDKIQGKGLSTEDYTTSEKGKLGGLANIKSVGSGLTLDSQTGELTATGGGGGGGDVTGVKGSVESDYRKGNVSISPANLGLGNVNNTSDTDKPVSTAQQTALNGKANLTNLAPAFSDQTAYTVDQYVTYNGDLYRCTTNHSAGAWDGTHFTAVTVGNEMYYNQPWSGTTTAWAALPEAEKVKYKEVHFDNDASNSIIDTVPTSGSANLVQSGGVFAALDGKVSKTGTETIGGTKTFNNEVIFNDRVLLGLITYPGTQIFRITDKTDSKFFKFQSYKSNDHTNLADVVTIDNDGNTTFEGHVEARGADYAEYFKSVDNMPMYRMVTIDGEIAKLAQTDTDIDDIIGITSSDPMLIGDKDTDGIVVGLMGKLWVDHDGTAVVNGYVKSGDNGIATRAKKGEGYRVMVVDGNRCRVLVK